MDELLSICCSSPPAGLIIDGLGICNECREWTGFTCGNCPDGAEYCECDEKLEHKKKAMVNE